MCGGVAQAWDVVFEDKEECCEEKKLWWKEKCGKDVKIEEIIWPRLKVE